MSELRKTLKNAELVQVTLFCVQNRKALEGQYLEQSVKFVVDAGGINLTEYHLRKVLKNIGIKPKHHPPKGSGRRPQNVLYGDIKQALLALDARLSTIEQRSEVTAGFVQNTLAQVSQISSRVEALTQGVNFRPRPVFSAGPRAAVGPADQQSGPVPTQIRELSPVLSNGH